MRPSRKATSANFIGAAHALLRLGTRNDMRDVNKNVRTAIVRHDEPVSTGGVKPFQLSIVHLDRSPCLRAAGTWLVNCIQEASEFAE